jgi:hypothetical protein
MPHMMRFPGRTLMGQACDKSVCTLDILPIAAAACGVPASDTQPLGGVNLLPYPSGERDGASHEELF